MSVTFKSFDQIEIDGISSGNIVDVISNHATKRLQVLEAYKVYTDKLSSDNAKALADQATIHAEALADLQADLDNATATVATLQATIASLEATIVELTPPPKPLSVTPAQIRLWLISNGISLDTVAQMIAAIPHEATREAAQVRWEYGLVVLREDPLVQQMGAALGFTTEQMDEAFLHASQID